MAKLCPSYEASSCGGECSTGSTAKKEAEIMEEADDVGGCGSSKGEGDEMRRVDEMLARKDHHLELDVDTTPIPVPISTKVTAKPNERRRKAKKEPVKQTLGQCIICGYMSSQSTCKACMLLEGLNRNRPKIDINAATGSSGHEVDINELEQAGKVQELTQNFASINVVPG
jgi:cytoplasmic tRNA 2-thiolation protein 1